MLTSLKLLCVYFLKCLTKIEKYFKRKFTNKIDEKKTKCYVLILLFNF